MGGRGSYGISWKNKIDGAKNVAELQTISYKIRETRGMDYFNSIRSSIDKKYKELKEEREITSSTYKRAQKRLNKQASGWLTGRR